MDAGQKSNDEQAALWNGTAGQGWVAAQAVLDGMFRPFETLLAEAVRPGDQVLDIGCGTGSTTLAAAKRGAARCLGVDISAPMIAVAQARAQADAASADFAVGDAQTHAFEQDRFDLLISRFGVMFFADPLAAFVNLRRAMRSGGRMRVIVWRGPGENPFMTAGERAAAPLLPELPPRPANAPGQFGFADNNRVQAILARAGWREVAIQPFDSECVIPGPAMEQYRHQIGPVARFLREAEGEKRAQLEAAIRGAFEPYRKGDEFRFTAACWIIEGVS